MSLKSLLSIIKFNSIFPDVFREVGLLDIITSLLIEQGEIILKVKATMDEDDQTILEITMELIYCMLVGPNNQNCSLFNEAQGAKHIFNFLPIQHNYSSRFYAYKVLYM